MSMVAELKGRQEEIEARQKQLLLNFALFRDGFYGRLEQFAREAAEAGLQGVSPCKQERVDQSVTKVTMALNGFDLVLVWTEEAHRLDFQRDYLGTKIFVYPTPHEAGPPFADITVYEAETGAYQYSLCAYGVEQDEYPLVERAVSEAGGVEAANGLIQIVYGFHRLWLVRPPLGTFLDERVRQRLGFAPPRVG